MRADVWVAIVAFLASAGAHAASGTCGSKTSNLNAATQELFDIVTDESANAVMDLARVKQLVAEGADVNALDESGANVFLQAVQDYAGILDNVYSSSQTQQAAAAALDVIEYLITQGADVSSCDGRDLTPAGYIALFVVRYGGDGTRVFKDLINAHADFGVQGGFTGEALIHLLAPGGLYQPYLQMVLANQAQLNVDLTVKTSRGITVLHNAAITKKPAPDQQLQLDYMYHLLPPSIAKSYIDLPDVSGETPLTFAIRYQNVDAVKYLLENYSPKLDRLTVDHLTPLAIAKEIGNQPIIDLLVAHGAPLPPASWPKPVSCSSANEQEPTFELIRRIALVDCKDKVKSIDDLLPLLPSTLRANYALVYNSRGAQGASFDRPRVITHRRDGKLFVAFNGDPSEVGYNDLEVIEFNDSNKSFEFHKISYNVPGQQGPVLSQTNPKECLGCHRSDPRPNWDRWSLWPGFYFGEMETLFPKEREHYQSYLAVASSSAPGRYGALLPKSYGVIQTHYGPASMNLNFNTRIDGLMESLIAEKAAYEMKQSAKLRPYRYALLGALSCNESINDFLTASAQSKLPRKYDDILAEVQKYGTQELTLVSNFQAAGIPGTPAGLYNTAALRHPYEFGEYGDQADAARVSALRYLVEGVLGTGSMTGWFNRFDGGVDYYVSPTMTPLEGVAWEQLLSPTDDQDLLPIYQAALPELRAQAGQVVNWFYTDSGTATQKLCPLLKQKSLKALAGI